MVTGCGSEQHYLKHNFPVNKKRRHIVIVEHKKSETRGENPTRCILRREDKPCRFGFRQNPSRFRRCGEVAFLVVISVMILDTAGSLVSLCIACYVAQFVAS